MYVASVVLRQKKEKGVRGPGRQSKKQTAKSHIGQYGISKLQIFECSGLTQMQKRNRKAFGSSTNFLTCNQYTC